MKHDIASLIAPIDWGNCKKRYPYASFEFIKALNDEGRTGAEKADIKEEALKAQSYLEKTISIINSLPTDERKTLFHGATVMLDHDRLDTKGPIEFRPHLESLTGGFASLAELQNPKYGEKKHKRDSFKHEICRSLALLFALDQGIIPKCSPAEQGQYTGPFAHILTRVLRAESDRRLSMGLTKITLGNLNTLLKPHRDELEKQGVAELRSVQKTINSSMSIFDLGVLKDLRNS